MILQRADALVVKRRSKGIMSKLRYIFSKVPIRNIEEWVGQFPRSSDITTAGKSAALRRLLALEEGVSHMADVGAYRSLESLPESQGAPPSER